VNGDVLQATGDAEAAAHTNEASSQQKNKWMKRERNRKRMLNVLIWSSITLFCYCFVLKVNDLLWPLLINCWTTQTVTRDLSNDYVRRVTLCSFIATGRRDQLSNEQLLINLLWLITAREYFYLEDRKEKEIWENCTKASSCTLKNIISVSKLRTTRWPWYEARMAKIKKPTKSQWQFKGTDHVEN
jgi:hypothetical protein